MLMLFANAAKAQYVNIPDSNFRKFLMLKYPTCFNSAKMMDTTCNKIVNDTSISFFAPISVPPIYDLDGLQYFKSLKYCDFTGNYVTTIPKLPQTLISIWINNNNISALPQLPPNLQSLNCSGNKLDSLPMLPKTITYLDVSSNRLSSLFNIPQRVKLLNCSYNKLNSLPQLNDSLESLNFSNNEFTQFPILPKFLKYLICGGDYFSFIDNLPESLKSFQLVGTNPTCLSRLPKKLGSFFANWNSAISCMPNYPDSCTYYVCSFNCPQIPPVGICNPTNNKNNCHPNKLASVFVFVDNNNNNKLDSNEFPKSNVKLSSSANNFTYSNAKGIAQIYVDSLGSYKITATPPAFYNTVPSSYTHNLTSYDTLIIDTFALQPNTLKDSLSIVATPINFAARPGFKYAYNIQYENVGTTVLSPTINFSYDNNLLTYDSSSNNAVVNNGSSLSLSQGIFAPGQAGSFTAYFKVKTTAALGTDLLAVASISAGNCNNVDSIKTVVRGSYDPNDKYATPTLTLQDVANRKYINYTIRFQNTGTDTAFNVIISDSLSGYLKINNLKGITSSHPCKFTLKNGVAYFEFIGINLPDSNTNRLACNGFVKFQILADENVAAGTVIPNKAYIYFDYNKAIITNVATTTIQNPLPLTLVNFGASPKSANEISVYWTTANEINTKYFIIEVSADGSNFKPAAELAAIGIGDNQYSYSIPLSTIIYIRLKIVDKDGKIAHSKIIKISEIKNGAITISPNPAKNYLNITVNKMDFSNTKSKLINSVGIVVKSFILKYGSQSIDISDLAIGVYYLQTGFHTIKVFVEK